MVPLENDSPPSALPDVNDKDLYCTVCKRNYPCQKNFRRHLLYTHNVQLSPPQNEQNDDVNIFHPDFYCANCNRNFSCSDSFKQHLKNAHSL